MTTPEGISWLRKIPGQCQPESVRCAVSNVPKQFEESVLVVRVCLKLLLLVCVLLLSKVRLWE